MSRRSAILLAAAAAALIGIPLGALMRREHASSRASTGRGRVVRFAGQDWGYPSVFGFYPRGPGYMHMSLLFDTLTWKDEHGVMGLLARSWRVSPDRRTYTFTLRANVRWHDGARLTAHDVAFSIRYLRKHAFTWTDMRVIRSAEALDDLTVAVELDRPHAPFLVDVAGAVPVIPAHVWRGVSDPRKLSGRQAVLGSGPFVLAAYSRTHGTYSYVANEHYFLGRPKVARLQYVAVGDSLLALKTGDIHALSLWSTLLDGATELRGDGRFRVLDGPSAWMLRLVFNHADADLRRRDVRRAFAYTIDLNEIACRLRHGHVLPGGAGFLPPGSPWRNPDIPPHPYDLGQARALAEATGLTNRRFTLLTTPPYVREADYIASQAGKAGIAVSVRSLPPSTQDALLREGKFELAIDGHGGIAGDPDVLRKQFCFPPGGTGVPASPIGAGRSFGYADAEVNALGLAQLVEADEDKRRASVYKMQEILARDLPTIVLWYPKTTFVYRPDVLDGWFYSPGGLAGGIPIATNKLVYIDRRTAR